MHLWRCHSLLLLHRLQVVNIQPLILVLLRIRHLGLVIPAHVSALVVHLTELARMRRHRRENHTLLHMDVWIRSAHHTVVASILTLSKIRTLAKYCSLTLGSQHALRIAKARRVDLVTLLALVPLARDVLWGWRLR